MKPDPAIPVKLLLVDDLPENLLALSALLRRDDIELLEARSGAEALELLLIHHVSLALVDVQMPELDGFELAELMRGSERTRAVPIIFVTAGASDERRVFKGYETGAVDFLFKPIDPHILKSKVDVFIELAQQRLQLARELREKTETLRLQEMFTAMLGHDLRGPLSAIVMGSILLEKKAADETTRRSAARTLASAKLMSHMISDMLDLARVRLAGGIPIRHQPVDLGALIAHAVDEQRASMPERRIALRTNGNLGGEWDAGRLAQIASNLIGNALQHGGADCEIECELDGTDDAEVAFAVSNAGCIPDDVLPHVFDPFRSRDQHRTRGDGLGLGLYIVDQIARAHGGRVEVLSGGADRKTTFRVTLPRAASAVAAASVHV
ncbi:MAG: hybrid sensor histidine kinase/response regulator [Burkholderiaceae bacterium]